MSSGDAKHEIPGVESHPHPAGVCLTLGALELCGGRMRGPCDAPPAPHLSDVTASGLISGAAQLPVSFPISALWGGSSLLGARQEEPSVQLRSGVELQPPWLCPSLCWPVAHPLPQCPSEDTRGAPVPLQPACPFPRSALGGAGTRPPSSLCLRKANTGTSCWGSSTPRAPPAPAPRVSHCSLPG